MNAASLPLSAASRPGRWLLDQPRHRQGLRFLQLALGVALLFRTATDWTFARYLWGPAGIAGEQPAGGMSEAARHGLSSLFQGAFATNAGTQACLVGLGLAAIGLIAGWVPPISAAVALAASSALNTRLPIITNGGDSITAIVLVYLLFTLPPGRSYAPGSWRVWLHNLAVAAIVAQTIIIYFTAGLAKASGETWQQGVALYYVSQVDFFSNPAMRALLRHALPVTAATYLLLFWELMFPVALLSRWRLPWIAVGLAWEIGMGYFMGLVTFAIVMAGLLLFLISDDEYRRLRQRLAPGSQPAIPGRPGP